MDPQPTGDLRLPLKPNEQKPQLPTALIGLLAYVSVLALVPLFACKEGSFERFHAAQGTGLFVLATLGFILAWILGPVIGSVLFSTVAVAELLLSIVGTWNVVNGRREALPLVGRAVALVTRHA